MKKSIRILALALIGVMFCGSFATIAYAKELEPCRLCGGKGDYHCIACGNTGTVTCDGCDGAGGAKCQGDTYKGNPCDNGYYTCSSCNGDGKNRSGDGKIIEGVCGNCGGAGKLRCVVCGNGTPGWNTCTRCGGGGKHECQVETCKVSRQYGWHCPDCKGTGFILVGNPMPPKENNDGVRNVPVKGDYIVTNDKTWAGYTYGGGTENSSDGNSENQDNDNDNDNDDDKNHGNSVNEEGSTDSNFENNENQEGKYIVWFGDGYWKIGDVTVTVDKTNIQYLNENDIITLKNFDADTMEVRLEAEDGFRTTLLVNNGKTSISANTNNGPIAIDIAFSVVAKEAKPSGEEDGVGDSVIIPSDRNQDFEILSTASINFIQSADARVEIGKMTEKEQENYTRLTDEELNKKLVNVKEILNSVRLGEFADDTKEIINEIAKLNGIDNLEDGKIFPLSFTGHENLGFPIAVTVRLEKGMLESDTDLFVYHILEDETIESLGKAEYTRYDDGSVESITFYTTGFSTFFTSTTELSILDSITVTEGSEQEPDKDNYLWIWGVLTVVVVGASISCVGLMKKKYNKL